MIACPAGGRNVLPLSPRGPTVPTFWTSDPAYAQIQNEHVWQTAWAEIIQVRATPQAAAEKAFKRVEEIFSKYPIA